MPENDDWPAWWPRTRREEYPYWEVWRGVSGLFYARRVMSSPPQVVRGESVEELERQIDLKVWGTEGRIAFDRA